MSERERKEDFYLGTLLSDRGSVTLARYLGVPIDRLDPLRLDYDARFIGPTENWPPTLKAQFLVDFKSTYGPDVPFELGNEYKDATFKETWGLTSDADYIGVVCYDKHDPDKGKCKATLALVDLPEWRRMWLDGGHEGCHTEHVCPEDSPCRWRILPTGWQQARGGTEYRTWCAFPSLSDVQDVVVLQIDDLEPVSWTLVPCSLLNANRVSSRKITEPLSDSVFVRLIEGLASEQDELLSPTIEEPVAYFSSTLVSSRRVQNLSHEGKCLFYMSIMVAHFDDGTVPADREKFNEHVRLEFSPEEWKKAVKELLLARLLFPLKDKFALPNWYAYQEQRPSVS